MEAQDSHRHNISPLVQPLAVFIAVSAAVTLVRRLEPAAGPFLIPALWGVAAVLPAWNKGLSAPALGLHPASLLRGLKFFLLSSVVIFPLYAAGFLLSARLGFPISRAPISPGISLWHWAVFSLAVVAFPEELFFRGYLQSCFEKTFDPLFNHPLVIFWFPILVSAFLFGGAHAIVDHNPARMAVFFPALLFGWLKAKTGTLIAPILSHGTANMFNAILINFIT